MPTPLVSRRQRRQIRDIEYFGGGTEWGKVFPSQPTRESVSLSSPAASENGFQCSPNVTECFSLRCLSKIDVQSESVSYWNKPYHSILISGARNYFGISHIERSIIIVAGIYNTQLGVNRAIQTSRIHWIHTIHGNWIWKCAVHFGVYCDLPQFYVEICKFLT